jgi:phospholipid/cholesterol/gamma-HCH transport system ATP-binding protein
MIELVNVNKAFEKKEVVKNLDLQIEKGERIAIIGPSGIGKSTLLRLMMGLHKPDSGNILIEGKDIINMNQEELKQIRLKFGMLFQSAALFDSMTVGQNIAFPLVQSKKSGGRSFRISGHAWLWRQYAF